MTSEHGAVSPDPSAHSHLSCPVDQETGHKLAFATALTAVIVVAEVAGGLWTHSLALLSDAAHAFTDVGALALSYMAFRLAQRPPSLERTYGWHRAEVFAALVNGLTLVAIVGGILYEAWGRLQHPPEVRATAMMIIAAVGLAANAIVLVRLGGHGHQDLNLRAAYLHVLGDLLGSVAVVIGGVVMMATGLWQVDPIISVLIACIVALSAVRLLYEVGHILLEGVPRGMSLKAVIEAMKAVPGVEDVHHLHAWSLCSNVRALSAHVQACPATEEDRSRIVAELNRVLAEGFNVAEVTLQLESGLCPVPDLLHAAGHGEAENHHGGTH